MPRRPAPPRWLPSLFPPVRAAPRRPRPRLHLEDLEQRLAPSTDSPLSPLVSPPVVHAPQNHSFATAQEVVVDGHISSTLSPGQPRDHDYFRITVSQQGLLSVLVRPVGTVGIAPQLSLYDGDQNLLLQSDDAARTGSTPQTLLNLEVLPGTYFIDVSAGADLRSAPGPQPYGLDTTFDPVGATPTSPTPPGTTPTGIGISPEAHLFKDVNRDGVPDLVTANPGSGDVSVLLGNGDGSFQPGRTFAVGTAPAAVAGMDLNGDGIVDLITANSGSNDVSVLLGAGSVLTAADGSTLRVTQGSFMSAQSFAAGSRPVALVLADVNHDGKLDIVTANADSSDLSVLIGRGDGSFAAPRQLPLGFHPVALALASLNDDAWPDLAVAGSDDAGNGEVSLLLGNGDGTFRTQWTFFTTQQPTDLLVKDVNGDGRVDLIVSEVDGAGAGSVERFLRRSDGSLVQPQHYPVGTSPSDLALRDVNRDQAPDLLVANAGSNDVSVLLNTGNGGFRPGGSFPVGIGPSSIEVTDINGDGFNDILTVNAGSSDFSVLAGDGTGLFQPLSPADSAARPTALALGDVNGDGIPDVVSISQAASLATVQLGNGDGSFQTGQAFATGAGPAAVTVADINGDHKLDLIIADALDDKIELLLGNGDGLFLPLASLPALHPDALTVGDVNGDGNLDLLVPGSTPGTISVWLGDGAGNFSPATDVAGPATITGLALTDVDGDGKLDLLSSDGSALWVALGNGDATFQPQRPLDLGADTSTASLATFAVGDVNDDGVSNLIAIDSGAQMLRTFVGTGSGGFRPGPDATTATTDGAPVALGLADVNGDQRLDVVALSSGSTSPAVLLNQGAGLFQAFAPAAGTPQAAPLVRDLNGDGLPDVLTIDSTGKLLYSPGVRSGDAPLPVVINPGQSARDVTFVALGSRGTGIATAHLLDNGYSVYLWDDASAGFQEIARGSLDAEPVRIASPDPASVGSAGDLGPLVAAAGNQVAIVRQTAPGIFAVPVYRTVGNDPSDIAFVNGAQGLDIVVTGRSSGDLSVLRDDASLGYPLEARFAAGSAPYRLASNDSGDLALVSANQTVAVVAAALFAASRTDLVTVNRGTHSLSVLRGVGPGVFAGPALTYRTSADPGQVLVSDCTGDGRPDLIVLMRDLDQVWVYPGQRDGTFGAPVVSAAGSDPLGLALTDVDGDGVLDLLVVNRFGGLLALFGDHAGHFIAFPADRPLVRADLNGNGADDLLVANAAFGLERLSVYFGVPGKGTFEPPPPTVVLNHLDKPLLPASAAQVVALDQVSSSLNLVVAASLFNQVFVYHSLAGGRYSGADAFSVGLDPIAVAVGLLDNDRIPDIVVADHGSNDLAVLLGRVDPNSKRWYAVAGPRIPTDGAPVSVALADFNGDGFLDFIVTLQGGQVQQIPGIGSKTLLLQALGFIPKSAPATAAEPPPAPGTAVLRPPPSIEIDRPLPLAPVDGAGFSFISSLQFSSAGMPGLASAGPVFPSTSIFATLNASTIGSLTIIGPLSNNGTGLTLTTTTPAVVQAVMPIAFALALTGQNIADEPMLLADLLRDPEADRPAPADEMAAAPSRATARPETIPPWAAYQFGLDEVFARHVSGFHDVPAGTVMVSPEPDVRGPLAAVLPRPRPEPEADDEVQGADGLPAAAATALVAEDEQAADQRSLRWLALALAFGGWLAFEPRRSSRDLRCADRDAKVEK